MLYAALNMKRIAALTIIILFSATLLQASTPRGYRSTWRAIAPPGGGFTIQMPGQPVKETKGPSTIYSYVERRSGGSVYYYGISHEDFPHVPADIDGMLKGQCYDFAKAFQGQVVKVTTLTQNGLKGFAARVEGKGNNAIVVAWLVNRRSYCIAFAASKTQVLPEEARQFIDSLILSSF